MSITNAQAAPYFVQYQEKFNEPCTLSLDALELALDEATDDEGLMVMLHDAQHATDDTDEADRSDVTVVTSGSAYDYAKLLADDDFQAHLETNALAALENKRGAAVIRRDLIRLFGLETIEAKWPIPGSTTKTHPGSNRDGNKGVDKYNKETTDQATGETKVGSDNGSWYQDLFDVSPSGKALLDMRASVKAAKAGESGKHVMPQHAALIGDDLKLTAEMSRIDQARANKKNAIVRAVNLTQRMARFNEETEMAVKLITVDGTPDGDPVQSNKLIYAYNSKDQTKFKVLTIGQLLALDIDKGKAAGGTYTAVIGTTKRAAKKGTGAPVQNIKVETIPQYDDGMAAFATFFDKLVNDAKATNALLTHLNSAGTDDLLLSMNAVMTGIDGYLSKPGIAKRLADLLADGKKISKAA